MSRPLWIGRGFPPQTEACWSDTPEKPGRAGCSRLCEPVLEAPVPVADILRYLMYRRHHSPLDEAWEPRGRVAEEIRKRLLTVDFTRAEKTCPQGIAIGRLMQVAAEVLG